MADSHHKVHGSYDPEEKRVGQPKRADSSPVHALCGPPLPRGHRKDLWGLDRFTGWIGRGGYYHWRLVQQGLIHHVPRLQDEPIPKAPKSCPSGRPLPARPPSAGTQALEAATGPPGQPTPQGGGLRPASNQGSTVPTTSQSGRPTASSLRRKSSAPSQSATPATSGGPTDQPPGGAGAGDGSNWYQTAI